MTIYGYARISTAGQSLEAQIEELKNNGCEVIFEEQKSGKNTERPVLQELLSKLQPCDTLKCTKLDRLARSSVDALQIVRSLISKDVYVQILNFNEGQIISRSPLSDLTLSIMASFAEFELAVITERLQSGRKYKRETDAEYVEGRPRKYSPKELDKYLDLKEEKNMSFRELERMTRISRATLKRRSKERELENAAPSLEKESQQVADFQKELKLSKQQYESSPKETD